jgi:hypothetical protein
MRLPFQPTFNSIVMILIGLALIAIAVYFLLSSWGRFFSVGFFFTGIGNILFGATNGFTDMTPIGQKLYRLALLAYIVGVPLIAYFLYKII